jgi:hypothetical protein
VPFAWILSALLTATPDALPDGAPLLIAFNTDHPEDLPDAYALARAEIEAHAWLSVRPFDGWQDPRLSECAGDPACFAKRAVARGHRAGLLLVISYAPVDEDAQLLGLRLIDVARGEEIASAGDALSYEQRPGPLLEQLLPKVFPESAWKRIASLRVDVDHPGAVVWLDGRRCVAPCIIHRIPTGMHQLTVRKKGYEDWDRPITVGSGSNSERVEIEREHPGLFFWLAMGLAGALALGIARLALP